VDVCVMNRTLPRAERARVPGSGHFEPLLENGPNRPPRRPRASGTFFREAARDAEERSGGCRVHWPLGSAELSLGLNLAGVRASSRSYLFADRHRSRLTLQKAPGRPCRRQINAMSAAVPVRRIPTQPREKARAATARSRTWRPARAQALAARFGHRSRDSDRRHY